MTETSNFMTEVSTKELIFVGVGLNVSEANLTILKYKLEGDLVRVALLPPLLPENLWLNYSNFKNLPL